MSVAYDAPRGVVVTGGTGALGRALVRVLVDGGARVAVPFRDEAEWRALQEEIGPSPALFGASADLADASAAQLTRYPEGLASALEKISGDREVLEVANRGTQHLYIVNPIKPFEERAKSLLSTHPPIVERVARIRAM